MKPTAAHLAIYANAFVIGTILMGFEMLGSRYLYPYFGGGIGTWAGLISTVLCALTIGYFAGGTIAGRMPASTILATATGMAGVYLGFVPPLADPVNAWILDTLGSGVTGILMAAALLLFVPVTCLGMFSPIAIRVSVRTADEAGRISGLIYGISTIGSVFGTLFTTYALIPTLGSRMITYIYAATLLLSSVSFVMMKRPRDD